MGNLSESSKRSCVQGGSTREERDGGGEVRTRDVMGEPLIHWRKDPREERKDRSENEARSRDQSSCHCSPAFS